MVCFARTLPVCGVIPAYGFASEKTIVVALFIIVILVDVVVVDDVVTRFIYLPSNTIVIDTKLIIIFWGGR